MFLLLTLVLGLVVLYVERGDWDPIAGAYLSSDGSGALTLFSDGWAAIYFTIVTLTTVGYGDLFPLSGWGKAVGAVLILVGTLIVPFPVSIYTESFSKAYNEYCRRVALKTELRAGEDVCARLSDTLASQLAAPPLPRFVPGRRLGDRGKGVVPQAIQLRRWAEVVHAQHHHNDDAEHVQGHNAAASVGGGDVLTLVELRNQRAAARAATAAIAAAALAGTEFTPRGDASGRPQPATATAVSSFGNIWGLTSALSLRVDTDAWTALSPTTQSPASPTPPSYIGDVKTPPPVGSPDAYAAMRIDRSPVLNKPLARKTIDMRLLREAAAVSTLPTAQAVTAVGFTSLAEAAASRARTEAAALIGSEPAVLCADSFSYSDLLQDAEVESAILRLLSDHRRRIWAEVRALEAKFRDDISMEVARRWARWMRYAGRGG
jgi:hypothetical protein